MSLVYTNNSLLRGGVFQAPWPQSIPRELSEHKDFFDKVKDVFLKALHVVVSTIVFPYGIYQVLQMAKGRFHKLLASLVIYPSPLITSLNKAKRRQFKEMLQWQHGCENLSLKTPDGNEIDGMLLRGAQKKAIIYCVGWMSYFEFPQRFDVIHDIKTRVGDVNLLLFNPRGVGESEGEPSSEGLVLDLYSAFKYLTEVEGIGPNDIVIYGHSLGGAYGAMGAGLIQKEYPEAKINLFVERSFASYAENLRGLFFKHLPNHPRVAGVISSFAQDLLHSCQWAVEALEDAKSLKGKICIAYNKFDEAVPFECSFYKKVKEAFSQQRPEQPIRCIKLLESESTVQDAEAQETGYSPHTRDLSPWEATEVANELKRMLGLEAEDPINSRLVKEIGGTSRQQLQGPDKDFSVALHMIGRLYDYVQTTADDHGLVIDRMQTVLDSLKTEDSVLQLFRAQEALLKEREDPLAIDVSPQGVKAFYSHVLARARTLLIVEHLEKRLQENLRVDQSDRRLLQILEESAISIDGTNRGELANPALRLYDETCQVYERYLSLGVPWPAFENPEYGRLAFMNDEFFPNLVRVEALQKLKRALEVR